MIIEHKLLPDIDMCGVDPDEFRAMVAERAYCKAEKRGFEPGHDMNDWLEAEKEISNQCRYWSEG